MRESEIRSARLNELSDVVRIIKMAKLYWNLGHTTATLAAKLRHDKDSILVVLHEGVIAGAIFTVYDPLASHISHIAVNPIHQRRGFGIRLVQEAEKRLRTRGTASIATFVEDTLSYHFFKKLKYHSYSAVSTMQRVEKNF